ncbi:MAG: hypothetical protein HYX65_12080 [Gemmatimonadetes bacterium]|nr:hypothetical protein [Gemmatimonadota bacterium]
MNDTPRNRPPDPMDDERLDVLLRDAAHTWNAPPAPPLDALWAGIERDAFATPVLALSPAAPRRRAPGWGMVAFAAAASLVIGVLAGQLWLRPGTTPLPSPTVASAGPQVLTAPASRTPDPEERLTQEVLARTALLLAALPAEASAAGVGQRDPKLAEQAGQLLTTTRRLLDSPLTHDRRMKDLLQDLELVLVQVARLRAPQRRQDLNIIKEAVEERELVPRIRSAVADLAGGGE